MGTRGTWDHTCRTLLETVRRGGENDSVVCIYFFQGPVAKELSGLPSGPSAGSGPPPPPPGPPPPPMPTSSGSDDTASRSALFAQINQGESITHGR